MFAIPIHDLFAWHRAVVSDERLTRDDVATALVFSVRVDNGAADIPERFCPSLEDLRVALRFAPGTYGKRIMTRPASLESAGYLHITRRTGKGKMHLYRITVPVDIALDLVAGWVAKDRLGQATRAFPDLTQLATQAAWEWLASATTAHAEKAGSWEGLIVAANTAATSAAATQSRTPASGYEPESRAPASENHRAHTRTAASGYEPESRTAASAKQDTSVLHPTESSQKTPSTPLEGRREAQAQTTEDEMLANEILFELGHRIGEGPIKRFWADVHTPGTITDVPAFIRKVANHNRAGHFDSLVAWLALPEFEGTVAYGPRVHHPARLVARKLNEFDAAHPLPAHLAN